MKVQPLALCSVLHTGAVRRHTRAAGQELVGANWASLVSLTSRARRQIIGRRHAVADAAAEVLLSWWSTTTEPLRHLRSSDFQTNSPKQHAGLHWLALHGLS